MSIWKLNYFDEISIGQFLYSWSKRVSEKLWEVISFLAVLVIWDMAHEYTSLQLRQNNKFMPNMHLPFHNMK
jgi:hypothetical protein